MRKTAAILLALWSCCALGQPANPSARETARRAYLTIREHPFEESFLDSAAADIQRAQAIDPKESYVYLAAAALVQTNGYKSGDWSRASSFDPAALASAEKFLGHAIELDPSAVEPHLDMAWMHLIARRFREAQHEYHVAHELAPDRFEVWYGEAVCLWERNERQKAQIAFAGAEARTKTPRQRRTLLTHKKRVAEATGDFKTVESVLQEQIELAPKSPQVYGNYGLFLMQRGRYDEAVAQYEKAVALGPYPLAVEQLEKAKSLRDVRR